MEMGWLGRETLGRENDRKTEDKLRKAWMEKGREVKQKQNNEWRDIWWKKSGVGTEQK